MKNISVFLIAVLFSATALAGPRIKQVDTKRKRMAVTMTSQMTMGSEWMVTKKDGTQCSFRMADKIGNLAIMKPVSCSNMGDIRVGQTMSANILTETQDVSRSSESRTKLKEQWMDTREKLRGLSLIAFYSAAEDVPATNGGTDGTYIGEAAFGMGAEYEYMTGGNASTNMPISLVGGLTYEFQREISEVETNGTTLSFTGDKPGFSLWTFYGNAKVHFNPKLSGFAGINLPMAMEKNFNDDNLESKLGYQVGGSFKVSDSIAADAMYRWINMETKTIKDMELNGFVLRGRYIF